MIFQDVLNKIMKRLLTADFGKLNLYVYLKFYGHLQADIKDLINYSVVFK